MALRAYDTSGNLLVDPNRLFAAPVVGEVAAFDLIPDPGETYPGFVLWGVAHGALSVNGSNFELEGADAPAADVLAAGRRYWIRCESATTSPGKLVVDQSGMVPVAFDGTLPAETEAGVGADTGSPTKGKPVGTGADAGLAGDTGAIAVGGGAPTPETWTIGASNSAATLKTANTATTLDDGIGQDVFVAMKMKVEITNGAGTVTDTILPWTLFSDPTADSRYSPTPASTVHNVTFATDKQVPAGSKVRVTFSPSMDAASQSAANAATPLASGANVLVVNSAAYATAKTIKAGTYAVELTWSAYSAEPIPNLWDTHVVYRIQTGDAELRDVAVQ